MERIPDGALVRLSVAARKRVTNLYLTEHGYLHLVEECVSSKEHGVVAYICKSLASGTNSLWLASEIETAEQADG